TARARGNPPAGRRRPAPDMRTCREASERPRARRPRRSFPVQVVGPRSLCLLADDLLDLLDRLRHLAVLVDDDVVVLRCRGHLDLRISQPQRAGLGGLRAATLAPAAE